MFPKEITHVITQALHEADMIRAVAVEIRPHEYDFYNCKTDRDDSAIEVQAGFFDENDCEFDCMELKEW